LSAIKLLAIVLVFFLTLSGVIDFFPIKNDTASSLADAPNDPDIAWIKENTPPDAVFLNTSYLYHPASLAGRKIFLGWPYFSWSLGYDTHKRNRVAQLIYHGESRTATCNLLQQNHIDYLETRQPDPRTELEINHIFFENHFFPVYKNPANGFTIYSVSRSCQ